MFNGSVLLYSSWFDTKTVMHVFSGSGPTWRGLSILWAKSGEEAIVIPKPSEACGMVRRHHSQACWEDKKEKLNIKNNNTCEQILLFCFENGNWLSFKETDTTHFIQELTCVF